MVRCPAWTFSRMIFQASPHSEDTSDWNSPLVWSHSLQAARLKTYALLGGSPSWIHDHKGPHRHLTTAQICAPFGNVSDDISEKRYGFPSWQILTWQWSVILLTNQVERITTKYNPKKWPVGNSLKLVSPIRGLISTQANESDASTNADVQSLFGRFCVGISYLGICSSNHDDKEPLNLKSSSYLCQSHHEDFDIGEAKALRSS